MATQNSIELVIRARNEAGPELRRVERDVEAFGSRFAMATRDVRGMGIALISELNPALGMSAQTFGSAAVAARGFGVVAGGLIVTVAATVAALVPMIAATKEAAEHQAQLNLAVRSFDAGAIRAQLQATAIDIATIEERSKSWSGSFINALRAIGDALGFTNAALEEHRKAQEAIAKVAPWENALKLAEIYTKQTQALQGLNAALATRADYEGNLEQFQTARLRMSQELSNEATKTEAVFRRQSEAEIAAAETRGESPATIIAMRQRLVENIQTLSIATLARGEQYDQALRTGSLGIRERDLNRALNLAEIGRGEGAGYPNAPGGAPSPDDVARIVRGIDQRGLDAGAQIAQARAAAYGLSRGETLGLGLGAIEAQRRQGIGAAEGRGPQEDAANVIAEIQARALALRHTEATDLAGGLSRGLTDVVDEFEATGLRMQAMARNTADAMYRGFSDQFFAAITGDFKALPEIGKSFAQNMVRAITDELAKMAAAPILRQLREAFGGGAMPSIAGITGAGAVLAPGVAGAVPLVGGAAAVAGQSYQVVSAGGQAVAVPIDMATAAASSSGTLANLSSTIGAALSTPIFYTSTGASASAAAIAAQRAGEIGTEAGNLGGSLALGAQQAGMTWGQAAGIVGSAAAFGFSVYGAYKTGDPYGGAIAGGLTGAMLGTQIYPGIGTAVGLVAGAAIGAGAGILGKNAKKTAGPRAGVRSAQAAQAGAAALGQAIAAATTVDDLVTILNRRWTPLGAEVQILARGVPNGRGAYWIGDYDDFTGFVWVAEDLFDPEVVSRLEVRTGPGGATTVNTQLTEQLQSKVEQIVGPLLKASFGYMESLTGGAISRETLLPVSRLSEAKGQRSIFVSPGILRDIGMEDNQIEFTIRRIIEVAGDRDIDLVPRERFA